MALSFRLPVCLLAAWFLAAPARAGVTTGAGYYYTRLGAAGNVTPRPAGGILLAGGGRVPDRALSWLCDKAGGGDLLILRSFAPDDYTAYFHRLCPGLNSVATLVVSSRRAADDEYVAGVAAGAAAIFIAGGNQAEYLALWTGTALSEALEAAAARGVAIGGTSAGMAILMDYVYAPVAGDVRSPEALEDPYSPRVTIERGFLHLPGLECTIADTHVSARNRIGRDAVFLARVAALHACPSVRGIFVDEDTALAVEPGGLATVWGDGYACFALADAPAGRSEPGRPLSFRRLPLFSVRQGGVFSLRTWSGSGGDRSTLSVDRGVVRIRKR